LIIDLNGSPIAVNLVARSNVQKGCVVKKILWVNRTTQRKNRRYAGASDNITGKTAFFVDTAVITNRSNFQVGTGLKKKLPANAPAIAVIDIDPEIRHIDVAVTFVIVSIEGHGDGFSKRSGNIALQYHLVEITVSSLYRTTKFKLRLACHHRNHACRCILAEQS